MSLTADVPDVVKLNFTTLDYLRSAPAVLGFTTTTWFDPCYELNRRRANRVAKKLRRKRERRAGK